MLYINGRFLTQRVTGVQRYAIEISKEIDRCSKLKPVFLVPRGELNKDLINDVSGFEIKPVGYTKGHVWEQVDLPLYMKARKGKAILLNLSNAAPLFHNKNIVTIHDLAFRHHPEWFSKKFSLVYNLLIPKLARDALHVFTVSHSSKQDISREFNIPEYKVSVAYNAVAAKFCTASSEPGLNDESGYFLCVGSLEPRKNLERLVKAFAMSHTRKSLLVVGGKNKIFSNHELGALVSNDKRIKLLGYVSDEKLMGLYSSASGFIYPSLFEGFGLPPIEAQAMGCPVIASNTTSLPEVLEDSALYCDPLDVMDIMEKINLLDGSCELREMFIKKGFENSKRFDWKSSSEKIVEKVLYYL